MIPAISLSLPSFLWLIFFLTMFGTTVYSAFLIYHWHAYGDRVAVAVHVTILYLIGAIFFLMSMATALTTLS